MLIPTPALETAAKLRLLLARIHAKQQSGQVLSASEENLLAECQYRYHSKPRETMHVDHEGNVTTTKSVNASPVMDAMKDYGDVLDRGKTGAAGAKMIGSIDEVTASIWAVECGAAVGTREFAAYAKKKLASPEFKRFRVGGGY